MKTFSTKLRRDKEGAILILVIAVLLGLSLIGLGLMNQSTVNGVEAATEVSRAQAFWTADAGIQRTMALAHKIWHSGAGEIFPPSQPRTWTGMTAYGTYTITINDAGTYPPGYTIISDGVSAGNDSRRLSISLLQQPALVAGVFGDIDLGLQPNARIYSYHSSSNTTPTPATSTGEAIIGSNEEISMKTSVILDGKILAGEDENHIMASTNGCEGKVVEHAGRMDPDPLGIRGGTYADLLNSAKTVNNNASVPQITANSWVVPNNATSKVSTGTYYLTSADIRGIVTTDTTNGVIEIFLSGPMRAWPGSIINASANASKFRIYSDSDAEITLQPSGDFGGLVYAPYSDMVRIQPGNNFYGVIWGDDIQMQPGGYVYMDADLLKYDAFRVFRIHFADWRQLQ